MKKCTFCAEEIKDEAIKCKHCGSNVSGSAVDNNAAFGARKCLQCGYIGQMKTWLKNYNLPQFIAIIGILFYLLPGIVFIGWGWGKYKCPSCGALAKNIQA